MLIEKFGFELSHDRYSPVKVEAGWAVGEFSPDGEFVDYEEGGFWSFESARHEANRLDYSCFKVWYFAPESRYVYTEWDCSSHSDYELVAWGVSPEHAMEVIRELTYAIENGVWSK